jgi:peptidylprolyl isomerase
MIHRSKRSLGVWMTLGVLGCSRPPNVAPEPSIFAEDYVPAKDEPKSAEPAELPPPKPTDLPPPEDVKAPPATAKRTPSGLAYLVLTPGAGKVHPKPMDSVTVHYTGWTTEGRMFDSSVVRGSPTTFALNQVITGWTEGLQLMVEGEKTRFWIPAELAYGTRPPRGAPAGMLVFEVELLSINPS